MKGASLFFAIALHLFCGICGGAAEWRIDCDFPGGNIVVVSSGDDVVHLRPDLRGTSDWWFYWYFRVRGTPGESLVIQFDGRSPLGARGPAVSVDGGHAWDWLGLDCVEDRPMDASFRYSFPKDATEVRFAFCPPYLEADWHKYLATVRACPNTSESILCTSEKQRAVEVLSIAPIARTADARVLITARHHACEAMASYALEGLTSAVCRDDETGGWLRSHVNFEIVPFVDKDGVEQGDQGKNRPPHDHWLDYVGDSRYKSVSALRKLITEKSNPPVRLALDIHCSYLRETVDQPGCSERVFFMESMDPNVAAECAVFQRTFMRERRGPIPYTARNDLPYGARWNSKEIAVPSFLGWASQLPGVWSAAVLELPYANADGVAVTPDSARAMGADLATAIRVYFQRKGFDE